MQFLLSLIFLLFLAGCGMKQQLAKRNFTYEHHQEMIAKNEQLRSDSLIKSYQRVTFTSICEYLLLGCAKSGPSVLTGDTLVFDRLWTTQAA